MTEIGLIVFDGEKSPDGSVTAAGLLVRLPDEEVFICSNLYEVEHGRRPSGQANRP
jgi:hypothetical protein